MGPGITAGIVCALGLIPGMPTLVFLLIGFEHDRPAARSAATQALIEKAVSSGRTTAADVARMTQLPIFHINGDDPEAAVYVAALAPGIALPSRCHW